MKNSKIIFLIKYYKYKKTNETINQIKLYSNRTIYYVLFICTFFSKCFFFFVNLKKLNKNKNITI